MNALPPLRLLSVHAHPDDEASKGASTVARYQAEGARSVLVCCTGGEAGDILNPAMDRPEVIENLKAVRAEELAASARIIGYDEVVMLGYRDSGMTDSEDNARPEAFANAPLEESVGRLVAIIRRERPQVIITYPDERKGYNHPDHLMVHDITLPAFEAAGDPEQYPEAGEPWQPSKLYFTVWSRTRMEALHAKFTELGLESPYDEWWFKKRESRDHLITTQIDIGPWWEVRGEALRAHATQIDPASSFWFGLPDEHARTVHPYDEYVLVRSKLGEIKQGIYEDDLFAGLRNNEGN
ncbi:MAG TPA: mycothiol conjugate amidase Mca [Acidimicrobiia bacterium]|jgi:mycothiol S-conjugate amidase|nr:mycothiol conjugate amidase Mca [Acidimicrobiia bacterium]HIL47277.1 mycothiol conjugate amidase Mca [Acidimicrobiia bacterium]